jgi:hypothetical protein
MLVALDRVPGDAHDEPVPDSPHPGDTSWAEAVGVVVAHRRRLTVGRFELGPRSLGDRVTDVLDGIG